MTQQRPGWWPDELAHAGDEHLDTSYVAGYDQKSKTDPSEDVAVLQALGLDKSSTVVDLGAGTGTFAFAIAPFCERVVAVDVSPAMLTTMKQHAEQEHIDNIEVVHGGFLSYQHSGTPADFVYSRNALHHLPDFWKVVALTRVGDMLQPGGVFRLHDLVFDCEPGEIGTYVQDWLGGAVNDAAEGFTKPEFETHLREEYSTFSWLLGPMLERCGFEIRDLKQRPGRPYAAYTCIKRS